MSRRKRTIRIIGEIPRLVPRPKPEVIVTTQPPTISTEQMVNLKRGAIGILTILDDMGILVPRCRHCYETHKWLNRCECNKIS